MIPVWLHKFKNDLSDSIVFVNEEFELVVDGFIGYPRGRPTDSGEVGVLVSPLDRDVLSLMRYFFPTLVFWVGHALVFRTMYTKTPEWSFARSSAALVLKLFIKKIQN